MVVCNNAASTVKSPRNIGPKVLELLVDIDVLHLIDRLLSQGHRRNTSRELADGIQFPTFAQAMSVVPHLDRLQVGYDPVHRDRGGLETIRVDH